MKFIVCFFTFFVLQTVAAQSKQNKVYEPEDAEEHFRYKNYTMALPIYLQLLKLDPDNLDYNYKVAQCYLKIQSNRAASIPFLELVCKDLKADKEAFFMLGKAYTIDYKFDEAIKFFKKYRDFNLKNTDLIKKVDLAISNCNNAKEFIKKPVNVTFKNLGPEINSEFPDYYPWVNRDETQLFFTSRRKGGHTNQVESDGYYSSDIFTSTPENGKWTRAKNLPGAGINTALDEEVVGIRSDGEELIIYIDHIDKFGDLYSSIKKGAVFGKLEKFGPTINSELEFSGSVSGNDDVLFFVRKSNQGFGEQDIYISKILPNGQWSTAQNLGESINTEYNEDFPFLAADGRTLYFASQGHNSMGGYDIFKSIWNIENNTWTKPVNLGYPLNTVDDERNFCILPDNSAAYLCANRKEGIGDLDIYRVKLEDSEKKYSVYKGKIYTSDSVRTSLVGYILAVNTKTKEEFNFIIDPIEFTYLIALCPGSYHLKISATGYEYLKEELIIFDIGLAPSEVIKDYTLTKVKK